MNKQHNTPTNQPTTNTNPSAQAPREPNPGITAPGYVCPLTGEILPCPKCCPINESK